jgi:DNA modification methylase
MEIQYRKTAELVPYARNVKSHPDWQVERIAASISAFGFNVPILVDQVSSVIAGAGRLLAAERLAIPEVPTISIDHLTLDQVRAFRIADNKVAESEWQIEDLKIELLELKDAGIDLELLGFDDKEINEFLYLDEDGRTGKTDPDDVPDPPETPVSKPGDIWACGKHRVLCGSATKPEDLSRLLSGGQADMVFTDPPYLMNFEGSLRGDGTKSHNAKHGIIKNDKMTKKDGAAFLRKICRAIRAHCAGAYYICFYRLGIDWLLSAMNREGLKWRAQIIWKKNNINLSNSDYKSLYEPIILGWADDYRPIFYGWSLRHEWYGRKNERDIWEIELPSVWEIAKTRKSDLHPTMKPVELVERAILNSSRAGGSVLDLFSGSGTTLIAAERRDRICYAMELDPKYCDVTIHRWEEFTGETAHRLSQ